jgi:hypothetical protein
MSHQPPLPPSSPGGNPLPPHVASARAEAAAAAVREAAAQAAREARTPIQPENATERQLLQWQCELLVEVRDALWVSTQRRDNMWSTVTIVAILWFVFSVLGGLFIAAAANGPRY